MLSVIIVIVTPSDVLLTIKFLASLSEFTEYKFSCADFQVLTFTIHPKNLSLVTMVWEAAVFRVQNTNTLRFSLYS